MTGVTALHLAVQRGNLAAVRCLLAAGADTDATDMSARTALYYAVQRNDVAVSELLAAYGGAHRSLGTTGSGSMSLQSAATAQYAASSKCSRDVLQLLQPVISRRHLPACCPTGTLE